MSQQVFPLPNRRTQMSLPHLCSSKISKPFNHYLINTLKVLCLSADPVYCGPCFAEERTEQRQRESDLLNIKRRHRDDVIDVRTSANLLHVGQVPLRNIQPWTQTQNTHREQVNHTVRLSITFFRVPDNVKNSRPKAKLLHYNTICEKHRIHFLFS